MLFGYKASAKDAEFKEVKTGDDVIENYIIANGGRENLEKITSIKITAKIEIMGKSVPMVTYSSSNYIYTNIDDTSIEYTAVYDKYGKKGWVKAMTGVRDLSDEEMKAYWVSAEGFPWGYYLNKEKFNINYNLKKNENINGKPVYVVDFMKGNDFVWSVYFDSTNFNRLKIIKPSSEIINEDFRLVGTSGIYMQYKITQQVVLNVELYEFNTGIDNFLLIKPELKQ